VTIFSLIHRDAEAALPPIATERSATNANDVTIFELDGQDLNAVAHWGAIPQNVGVRFHGGTALGSRLVSASAR
jgi:hypothetical protein